jgi:two-component system cell cycle sensor histidine kinase PleC
VESALTRNYQGTGLGLPLTKSFVEMHGGSLELKSSLGDGTEVTLRFPAARVQLPLKSDQSEPKAALSA